MSITGVSSMDAASASPQTPSQIVRPGALTWEARRGRTARRVTFQRRGGGFFSQTFRSVGTRGPVGKLLETLAVVLGVGDSCREPAEVGISREPR